MQSQNDIIIFFNDTTILSKHKYLNIHEITNSNKADIEERLCIESIMKNKILDNNIININVNVPYYGTLVINKQYLNNSFRGYGRQCLVLHDKYKLSSTFTIGDSLSFTEQDSIYSYEQLMQIIQTSNININNIECQIFADIYINSNDLKNIIIFKDRYPTIYEFDTAFNSLKKCPNIVVETL